MDWLTTVFLFTLFSPSFSPTPFTFPIYLFLLSSPLLSSFDHVVLSLCTKSCAVSGSAAILMVYWWTMGWWVLGWGREKALQMHLLTAGPTQLNYSSNPPSWMRPVLSFSTTWYLCAVCTLLLCEWVSEWVREGVRKWGESGLRSYLSVRSHHGITGVVWGRLRVRGRLRSRRTLVKKIQKDVNKKCYNNIFGDI